MSTKGKTLGEGRMNTRIGMREKELSCSLPRQLVKGKGTASLTKQIKDFKAEPGKKVKTVTSPMLVTGLRDYTQ